MAEENDTSKDSKPKKRRIRSNTETVRERMAKVQAEQEKPKSDKPSAISTFGKGFTWPLRQIARPFRAIGRFLGRFRFFRLMGRILLPYYIRSSWQELKLVTWPDRRTSWKLTYAVIVFSVIFGVIVFVVDFALDKVFKELIIK